MMAIRCGALRRRRLLAAARETLTGTLRRKKDRSVELIRALRYKQGLVYENLDHRWPVRSEREKLYAEAPDYEGVAIRLGIGQTQGVM